MSKDEEKRYGHITKPSNKLIDERYFRWGTLHDKITHNKLKT